MVRLHRWAPLFALLALGSAASLAYAGKGGQLTLVVTDRDTGLPIACRMHLKNARNQPHKPPKIPFWHDHFVVDGSITLTLPVGDYNFEVERGPEYLNRIGHFTVNDFAEDTHAVDLKRVVDMGKEGWWSGDLYVDRPEKDMPLILEAEDLHLAQLVGKPTAKPGAKPALTTPKPKTATKPGKNAKVGPKPGVPGGVSPAAPEGAWMLFPDDRCFMRFGQTDARAGNLFIVANLSEPLVSDATTSDAAKADTAKSDAPKSEAAKPAALKSDPPVADAAAPPLWELVGQVRQQPQAWIDAGRAFSWDLPVLVAEGQLDSIELANSHMGRASVIADEAGGKPADKIRYAGESGIGRWSAAIYYHLLNCGLRIPPSAGSGSGIAPNPVGYDRMYVQMDGGFSVEKWWEGFKAGRVVVTNGPLLRPICEGEYPGHLFQFSPGEGHEFEIGLTLSTRDQISYLEVVQDGAVVHMIRLAEWVDQKGRLPKVNFSKSGWFLVRAVAEAAGTYRFASSGPYYVAVGDEPRISKASAQFFVDWVNERAKAVTTKIADADERAAAVKRYKAARAFWQALVEKANAE